jgi:very-short-patch-repair endonuclease
MVGQTTRQREKPAKNAKKQAEKDLFTIICKTDIGVEVVKEYRFCPARRWRFDYAILEHKIAVEVEGGAWTHGRHTRPLGFINDMEKYNTGTLLGWRIFRVTPDELHRTKTIDLIKNAILV